MMVVSASAESESICTNDDSGVKTAVSVFAIILPKICGVNSGSRGIERICGVGYPESYGLFGARGKSRTILQ
ncbi:MAG TPA: hypothetical protein ENG11_02835 [candidate division Zixibacteria bacterium]|nr:hypothetical protein [candidate division Zixibacteria bacterium]